MMKIWQPNPDEIKKTENWDIWKKEESEFEWYYEERETCYIIRGQACVNDNSGNKICFKAGEMVRFEKGLKCRWKITKQIEKRYYFG
jgi:uncharacterized cupin superfamily protein